MPDRSVVLSVGVLSLLLALPTFCFRSSVPAQSALRISFADITEAAHLNFKHEASLQRHKLSEFGDSLGLSIACLVGDGGWNYLTGHAFHLSR